VLELRKDIFSKTAKMLTKNRRRRVWLRAVSTLSCVVVFCTVYALILPAITLEKKPSSGNADPTYSEACDTSTARIPVCTPESLGIHQHTEECLDENGDVRCGYADFVVHTHDDSCYDENGERWCLLPEIKVHTHGDACYALEQPAEEKKPTHIHTDECYAWSRGALNCGLEEGHTHSEACYAVHQSLICTLEEGTEHAHTAECYQQESVLECTTPENHSHTDACYERVRGELICGLTETAETTQSTQETPQRVLIHEEEEVVLHTHTADCFEKDENGDPTGFPICGWLEVLEHVHNDVCFQTSELVTAAVPASAQLDGTFVYTGDPRFTLTLEVHGTVPVDGEALADMAQAQPQADPEPVGESQPEEDAAAPQERADLQEQTDVREQTDAQEQIDPQERTNAREAATLDPETLHLSVEVLGEEDPDHAAAVANLPENSMISLAVRFSLRDEQEQVVDLTNCEVLDTLNLTQDYYVQILADATGKLTGEGETKELTLSLCQLTDTALKPLASVPLKAEEGHTVLGTKGVKSGVLALMARSGEDPTFTVQYYGNLKKLVTSMHLKREGYSDENYQAPDISTEGAVELNILNTGNPGKTVDGQYLGLGLDQYGRYRDVDGAGGSLPTNYETSPTFKIYLQEENDEYRAIRNFQLMNIYRDRSYTYSESHTLSSLDILREDGHYQIKNIWVLKPGENVDPHNLDESKWDTYSAEGIQFTNDPTAADDQTIYIPDGAVIRLVYDETEATDISAPVKFYDYDITDGTGNTLQQGINSPENYPEGEGAKLAFGNSNTATSLGTQEWNGQHLNEFNKTEYGANKNASAPQSTFGITTGLDAYGRIRYADGILAPKIFDDDNGEPVTGKTNYDNGEFQLLFDRIGSTYTLAQVVRIDGTPDGTRVTGNLRAFTRTPAGPYSNNFWPMDSTPGADGMTGGTGATGAPIRDNGTADYYLWPESDDKIAHNNMFGMEFQVDFQLDGDYCGPLEYYFFGDDDLWVYLDGKLICDIGGIHMSNGEFVNLWDWIPHDDTGKHTMKIYYTERGLSGSTCYMRFTIPGATIESGGGEPLGTLEVAKVMGDPEQKVTEPFDFTAAFTFPGKTPETVSYRRLDADGKQTERGTMPLSNGKVSFQLKAGETIRFLELPAGTTYRVQEHTEFYEVTNTVNGTASAEGDTADGTVSGGKMDRVLYTNESLGATDVTVHKKWRYENGAEVTDTSALPKIEVELYQIKTEQETGIKAEKRYRSIQLPIDGSWDYTWHGLPTEDNKGNTYTYRVGEPLGPGFVAGKPKSTTDESGNTTWEIVNTVTPPDPTALTVYKYWKNADGTAMAPPEDQSAEVQLYQKVGTKQTEPFHTITIQFPRVETKTYQVKSGESFSYKIVFYANGAAQQENLFKTCDTDGVYQHSYWFEGIKAPPQNHQIWIYSKTIDKVEQDTTIIFTEGDLFYPWQGASGLMPLYQGPDYEPTITAEYTAPAVSIDWAEPVEYRTVDDPNAGKAKLSKENQWRVSWNDLPAENDRYSYLYYVKELPAPEDFTVTYLVDGKAYTSDTVDTVTGIASGVIEITNTSSKVEEPGNEKTVEEDSTHAYGNQNDASIGQTVNFKSAVTLPVGSRDIVFHDTMSTDLTPYKAEDKIKIYTDEAMMEELDTANYTVNTSPADGCTFEVSFAQDYLDGLTEETAVYVKYAAAVNESARIGAGDGNPNTSFLSYSDGNQIQTTLPSTTRTYTWGIDVLKYTVDGTNAELPLSGARFTLREEGGTDPIRLVKSKDGSNERPKTADVYRVAMAGEEGDTVETNATGKLSIQGLDAGTYYLTETSSPVGYKKLAGPIKVVIDSAANADGETMRATVTYYTYTGNDADPYGEMASGTGEIKVRNEAGIKLPSTGGTGVTVLYISGLFLMVSAAVLLTVRKRRT